MIIDKIDLENFMCYSGKTSMLFKEGINVIVGDNGYGKSKLYDAFYWVLYDQVFESNKKEFIKTGLYKENLISDKTRYETPVGKITAKVAITFRDLDNDKVIIIERRYSANNDNGTTIGDNGSELSIMKKDLSYLTARLISDEEEKQRILRTILPFEIKDYLWFQGEQVESIIDFNKQDSLTKAINALSSIARYDELKSIAVTAAKSANNEYDRDVKRLSKDSGKSEQLSATKVKQEAKIVGQQAELNEVNENLSRAEARCEELLNKIEDAQRVNELQQEKRNILARLNELNEELKGEQTSFHRKMFRSKWVLKGTTVLHEQYARKFSAYEQRKLQMATEKAARLQLENETVNQLQTRLPFNVPEPNYLEWMLEKERCLVCDREAKTDSEEWRKIKELLDRPQQTTVKKSEEPLTLHDFSDDFKRLYQNGLSLNGRINEIDDDIKEALAKRNNLNKKVRDANNEVGRIEETIQRLLAETLLTTETAKHILDEYSVHNKYVKDYTEEKIKLGQQIEHSKNILKGVEDQLKELVTGEIPAWLIEKKEILTDFESVAISTRDRVFNSLITQLEKEANTHYEAMTSGNRSAKGQIKLRKLPNGNYMPEIIDDAGIPLRGINTGNLILVKLSAIMAIISAKNSGRAAELYTLITDAPTSVFGEDYTIGFCKTVSKVYKQSIIMSKEFYKNESLRNELLTNAEIKIGNVYMISPSILATERDNRNNLSTNLKALN
ncbi:AAA family ATPase [Flavitalea sp.]|nr:hypothetical protein [Flavitalea sp.]